MLARWLMWILFRCFCEECTLPGADSSSTGSPDTNLIWGIRRPRV